MDAIVASFGLEEGLLRGFVFGLVHVGILIIGYYSGWSINRLLKRTSNGHIAGIVGAVIAHVLADLIASLLDPTMRSAALGIVLGVSCLYYLFLFLRNMSLRVMHILWWVIMKILKMI